MASNTRSSGTAAFRYASALVDLAMEGGSIPQIEKDVRDLRAMTAASDDLRAMLSSPLNGAGAQQAALSEIVKKAGFSPLMGNFLNVLAQNRRLKDLDAILGAVQDNLSSRRGEMKAKVQSASALSAAQEQAIAEQLSKTLGQPVAIEATVAPELIGGVTITMGSFMIDDSVKTKLDRLARAMKSDSKAA